MNVTSSYRTPGDLADLDEPQPVDDLLIVAIGNVLLQDEGVGVHVAGHLAQAAAKSNNLLPPGTRILDGGTLGLELLPLIERARALLLIDAVNLGQPPGSVEVLRGDALSGVFAQHLSAHQMGVSDILAVGRLTRTLPERVALVGIQPAAVAFGLELSPTLQAALPTAVAAVRQEAWALMARDGGHA